MTQADHKAAHPVLAELGRSLELAFPPALMQLTQTLVDPMPDYSTISRFLSMDPGLAGAVLQIANSPAYGLDRRITDIQQAVIALGTDGLFKLVISLSMQKRMSGVIKRDPAAQFGDWRTTLWGAIAAEELAFQLVPAKATEAYLVTLLKDLSLMLTASLDSSPEFILRNPLLTLVNETESEKERLLWGTTHPLLAADFFARWGMPHDMIEAVVEHHHAANAASLSPLSKCVALATRWAELMHGAAGPFDILMAFEHTLARDCGLKNTEMNTIRERCTRRFKTLLTQLGIQENSDHSFFYQHTLPTLQQYYFLSMELKPEDGGFSAMVRRFSRHLQIFWGITEWELALQLPESTLVQFFQCNNTLTPVTRTPAITLASIPWTPGFERISLTSAGIQWGQFRYPKQSPTVDAETFSLYMHFVATVLQQYNQTQALYGKQTETYAQLPFGVARIHSTGCFIDANQEFLRIFTLASTPRNMTVHDLFQHWFSVDMVKEWHEFFTGTSAKLSRQTLPVLPVSGYPNGFLFAAWRSPTATHGEIMLALFDATSFTNLFSKTLEREDFLAKIFNSTHEQVYVIDDKGMIRWAGSQHAKHLQNKNIFSLAKPSSPFFAEAWDPSFLVRIAQTVVVDALMINAGGTEALMEITFTPLRQPAVQHYVVVCRDFSTIRRYGDAVRQQITTDPLTGLLTHSQFHMQYEREAERAAQRSYTLGIIYCDIDNFSVVNQVYGYKTGDAILRKFALNIRTASRKGKDICARYANDNFVIIFPEATQEMLEQFVDNLRKQCSSSSLHSIEINFGLTLLHAGGNYLQSLQDARDACGNARSHESRCAWVTQAASDHETPR